MIGTMRLVRELERRLKGETSLFQAQLLREDLARLAQLRELARTAADAATYGRAAMRLGWTQSDARTAELRPELDALVSAVRAYETEGDGTREADVENAWRELHRVRMERLVGCLATRVPKPADRP